jgi:hypothetical protein
MNPFSGTAGSNKINPTARKVKIDLQYSFRIIFSSALVFKI